MTAILAHRLMTKIRKIRIRWLKEKKIG